MENLVKEHAGAFAGMTIPRSATAGQRTEERQRHRLPSVDGMDYPHLAGPPPVAPADEPLDLYEVTLFQRGYTPEIVFLGSRQDCRDFADECREDTIGCDFRVARSGRTTAWMKVGEA